MTFDIQFTGPAHSPRLRLRPRPKEAVKTEHLKPDTCEMCGGLMETIIGPETWQDTTHCTECDWSPDDPWRLRP